MSNIGNFPPEETTKVEVKHPTKPPKPGNDLFAGPATDGKVGDVSMYATFNRYEDREIAEHPDYVPGKPGIALGIRGGRPNLLEVDDGWSKKLFENLEKGHPVGLCCRLANIDNSTITKWRKIEAEGGRPDLTRFFLQFNHSRALGELTLIERSNMGDDKGWSHGPSKCAQWLLERAFGDKYAPRVNMKVEEVGALTLNAIEKVCSDKDCGCYAEILAALQSLEDERVNGD